MPSEVAWSLEGDTSGVYEILFPDDATSFQIYDADDDVYRVIVVHCDSTDARTRFFQFEKTPDIDMEGDVHELEQHCDDDSLVDEMEHTHGYLLQTHVRPDVRMDIFIGHQAVFSDS